VKRREFITLLSGVAAWPLVARAQQPERVRRIGVLMSMVESDPTGLEYITAFAQGLAEQDWIVGRNVRIEYRWGAGDLDRFRRYAAELVALSPDVVLAAAGSIVGAFQQASRTIRLRSRRTNRARRERKRHRIPNSFIQQEFGLDPLGGSRIRNFANLSAAR
jgi:putative ABC transport system substrate-binding protein